MKHFVENNVYQKTAPLEPQIQFVDVYEAHGGFSINASYELQGSFWLTKNGQVLKNNLGQASYTVLNKDHLPVGINESGLNPNVDGLYKTTAFLATSLVELTHYIVKISIVGDGQTREAYVAIGLLEG
jgi:hypothetical protein